MTVLELYRAQRDTPSQVQAAPPSPTFRVQYQPDAPPVYHTLFAVLSSQATVVDQDEFDAIRRAVRSPPDTPSPEVAMEAVERVLPSLTHDAINNSVQAMEQVLAQSSAPNQLELSDIPPEVWATLRVAVPTKGSSIHDSISRASSFAEVRDPIRSANSSPMDDSPTNPPFPLFLPGSSGSDQPSVSYHPQSLEVDSPLPHAIGNHSNPIYVHSSSPGMEHLAITQRLEQAEASLSVEPERLTPVFQQQEATQAASINLRSMGSSIIQHASFQNITRDSLVNDAETMLHAITNELNQAVEGHSHYFLREPLTILADPALPVKTEELRRILDISAAVLSGGPSKDQNDVWTTLRPSDWFRASTHIMASILRGAVRTKKFAQTGNFPLEPMRDDYRRANSLPQLETQRDLLEALSLQIAEQLSLENGPYLPEDSVSGIRATVWRAHEAQIRAAVARKANEVEDRISTMGLAELIDNLLNEASMSQITTTLKEDVELQIRSKYNNACLAAENDAYHALIKEATKEGKARAAAEALQLYADTCAKLKEMKERQAIADAEIYYKNQLDRAKSQARLQADSKFSRLLADERSAIAPRKECVLAAAVRLGLDINNDGPASKKVKAATIARDDQKTPTPDDVGGKAQPGITTVSFSIKREPSPFRTPSTPSVIQNAVDLIEDIVPTQESIPPLWSLSSSIHNEANQMAIERESFDPASLFPPGIPPPPARVSLPPPMSRTPQFGGAEAMEDGVAPSCSPEVETRNAIQISVDASIGRCLQPLWETIHRLEALLTNNIPRAPPRAGPGYRTEHINKQAPKVSSAAIAPWLTNQGTRTHDNTEGVTPSPSVPPVTQTQPEPPARVDDEEFPSLSRGQWRRFNAQARNLEARCSVPGAVSNSGDDGYIPITSNNSRIKPLFANVITQSAVAQQQQVQRTAAQARAVQGRKPAGNQGARMNAGNANLTEVTFRARNPVAIVQAVQRELGKRAKNPPAVLSGRWSTTSQTTGNFVYTLAGTISPRDLMALKPFLCSPFKGCTELVPTKGWTWIQLRLVPTKDIDGKVWGPDDLLKQFIANRASKTD
ncbi:hypothetical protein V8E53_001483 [Lactarius tabidus]